MSNIGGTSVENSFGISRQLEFKSNSSKGPQYKKTEELVSIIRVATGPGKSWKPIESWKTEK